MSENDNRTVIESGSSSSGAGGETVIGGATVVETSVGGAGTAIGSGRVSSGPSSLPMPGEHVGPWIIEKEIGRGGMGAVYRVSHRLTHEIRALKVISPEYSSDKFFVDIFVREAGTLSKCQSESIVQYRTCDQLENGLLYIVMDLIEGISLKAYIGKHGKLPPDVALTLLKKCAEGLEAVHRKDIVHRDLKPENIILAGEDPTVPKIIDFGIAKNMDEKNIGKTIIDPGGFAGTPFYASPEQLYGRLVDERSDFYSLALVVFHAVTGKSLREGMTPQQMLRSADSVPNLAQVPEQLRAVLSAMLEPDQAKRPTSLSKFLGAPSSSRPAAGTLIAAGIGVAVLLLGGVGFFVFSGKKSAPPVSGPAQAAPVQTGAAQTAAIQPPVPAEKIPPLVRAQNIVGKFEGMHDWSRLSATGNGGAVAVSGIIPSAASMDELKMALGPDVATSAVQVVPPPFCQVPIELRNFLTSDPGAGVRLEPASDTYHDGQRVSAYVAGSVSQESYVYFEVVDMNGDIPRVTHLDKVIDRRALKLHPSDAKGTPATLELRGPGYGTTMILAIVTSAPVLNDLESTTDEGLQPWLDRVRDRLNGTGTAAQFSYLTWNQAH